MVLRLRFLRVRNTEWSLALNQALMGIYLDNLDRDDNTNVQAKRMMRGI